MTGSRISVLTLVLAATLLAGCKEKDSELRWYVRSELGPYLDSLAYQICRVREKAKPDAPGPNVCHGPPEGYKPPPKDGTP
jgi:hypothetical protein